MSEKITVVIPVYNALDRVCALIRSLLAAPEDCIQAVIIGDDASDAATARALDAFSYEYPIITVVHRDKNVGYLRNVNDIIERATTDLVVLLNSDTRVPELWLSRILACFCSDPTIALALPLSTNANHVTVRPANGQSWRDLDAALASLAPQYPDAPTAVGCGLGIRRSLVDRVPIFDECYDKGYWEDTDLHFFVRSKGWRSVLVDNLLIYHGNGSSSFSESHDLPAISSVNRSIFMRKWGADYIHQTATFTTNSPLRRIRDETTLVSRHVLIGDLDVLFILPTIKSSIGGIAVVIRLLEALIEDGKRAAIFVTNPPDMAFVNWLGSFRPFTSLDEIKSSVSHVHCVIATSWDSFEWARDIASFFDCKVVYLVQGPEVAFNNGAYASRIAEDYKAARKILTVSPFLARHVKSLKGADSVMLRMGPSSTIFYPRAGLSRDTTALAVCLRSENMKGSGHAIANALIASKIGFKIHFFGAHFPDVQHIGKHHGELTDRQIAILLSSVGFYMDCSMIEGLGLLPLEAAFCGAIPIVLYLHGLDHVLVDNKNAFVLPDEFSNDVFFATLRSRALSGQLEDVRDAGVQLAQEVNAELAFTDFILALEADGLNFTNKGEVPRVAADLFLRQGTAGNQEPLAEVQTAITSILNSTSWRFTSPVRALASIWKKTWVGDPDMPTSHREAVQLLVALTTSSSWWITAPLRTVARLLQGRLFRSNH